MADSETDTDMVSVLSVAGQGCLSFVSPILSNLSAVFSLPLGKSVADLFLLNLPVLMMYLTLS